MRTTARLGSALHHAKQHFALLPTEVMRRAGLGPKQVRELEGDGLIERIVKGLYRLPGTRGPLQDLAAALHQHPRFRGSHTTALHVHGIESVRPPAVPHLTGPPGATSSSKLAVLHRSPLLPEDCTRRQGLPVTTLARAIVDAAELLPIEELATVVNEAVSRRMVLIPHIVGAACRAEAGPGRKGSGRLRAVLATWTDAIQPDSVAEAAVIRRIRTHGLPAPVAQFQLFDDDGAFVARMDVAWPEQRVAREYQSVQWHRPDRIEDDEARLQKIEALGWVVEPLFRYHLLPGEVEWLRTLARQLRRAA